MTRRLRDHGPALAIGAAAAWAVAYVSLYGFGWNDYESESLPAYTALTGGHIWQFLKLAPVYGGSLELRAPFALLPGLWHGNADAVYQATSAACLAAAVLLAVWLVGHMRAIGQSRFARLTALALFVFNPVTLYALQDGHAEELLGGVLCIAAVLVAMRGHVTWAGLLLGLAIVNKEWALLAVGPVLLALQTGRVRALLIAAGACVVFYVPLLAPVLAGHGSLGGFGPVSAAGGGQIFQPWQLWWFLGSHGQLVHGTFGAIKPGYRTPPGWISGITHPLIIALSVPATLLASRRGRSDALLLLVFLLALRCALDTWNFVYYELPFVLALLAWEGLRCRRPPILSVVASVTVWLLFIEAPGRLSPDAMSLVFAALALPTLFALALALYGRGVTIPAALGRDFGRRSSAPAPAPISTM